MSTFDSISDFVKSGPRRYDDALELMEMPTASPARSDKATRHLRGAMYLAGYSVECLIKAYLIEQEGCQTLRQAQDRINVRRISQNLEPIRNIGSSIAGHSIDYLIRLTNLSERPGYDPRLWGRLAKWDTTWRYNQSPLADQKQRLFRRR